MLGYAPLDVCGWIGPGAGANPNLPIRHSCGGPRAPLRGCYGKVIRPRLDFIHESEIDLPNETVGPRTTNTIYLDLHGNFADGGSQVRWPIENTVS